MKNRMTITAIFAPSAEKKQSKLIFNAVLTLDELEELLTKSKLTAPDLMILHRNEGIQIGKDFLEQIRLKDPSIDQEIEQAYITLNFLYARNIRPDEIELMLSTEELMEGITH